MYWIILLWYDVDRFHSIMVYTLNRANPSNQRKGHMGYLTRIANTLATRLERGPNKEILQFYFKGNENINSRYSRLVCDVDTK